MSNRVMYISRGCPHCKKLLIGIHKYDFLKSMFIFVDIETNKFPDYIKSVPTLVVDQNMIKGGDVFGYMNNMVQEILQQNPGLDPQQQQQGQQQGQQSSQQQGQQQEQVGQPPSTQNSGSNPSHDPVDDLVGWCPGEGCSFADITEQNDDFSKKNVSLEDTRFSFISGEDAPLSDPHSKVGLEQSDEQFKASAKRQQMDASYERLMAERQLVK